MYIITLRLAEVLRICQFAPQDETPQKIDLGRSIINPWASPVFRPALSKFLQQLLLGVY
jgi:hypothetical protein